MKRLKIRHWIVVILIGLSVAVTPYLVHSAYEIRGYWAFGGEWLIVGLGVLLSVLVLEFAKAYDEVSSGEKRDDARVE